MKEIWYRSGVCLFGVCLFSLGTLVVALSSWIGSAHAISIDSFKDPSPFQTAEALGVGGSSMSNKATTHAVGGARKVYADVSAGSRVQAAQRLISSNGKFSHASDDDSKGQTRIVWDGEVATPETIAVKYNGLRGNNGPVGVGIDLTEDGAKNLILNKLRRDLADGLAATITVRVYDASNPTKICSHSFSFDQSQANADTTRTINFANDFTAFGAGITCDPSMLFKNVGAIELIISGTVALDLSLASVVTDGVCPALIPANGAQAGFYILDLCGVCGGNNSKCKDCAGNVVPNTTPLSTVTEFNENGGGACATGEFGICQAGVYSVNSPSTATTGPVCRCDRVQTPTAETCDGLDNNCNDQIDEVFDLCNVRCGDNSTCKGCDGVPNSGKVPDACGICGGNGSSCLGCDGISNSGKKKDVCGICDGDGASCTSACQKTEIRETLFQLDAQAKVAEKVIIRGLRTLNRNTRAKRYRSAIKKLLVEAHELQIKNWILSWTLPEIINSCENDIVCFKSSNVDKLTSYRETAGLLLKLNDQAAKYLRRVGLKGKSKLLRRKGRAVYGHALELAASVPETTTVCNIGTSLP